MKEIVLIKLGEMVLKGLNRRTFEDVLLKNIKYRLRGLGKFEIKIAQSTIYINPLTEDTDLDDVCERIGEVFGIVTYSRACVCEKDFDDILSKAPTYAADALSDAKTFKVESKRSDKRFPYKSPEISAQVGGKILERFPYLKVDVKNPDVTVTVEVRDFGAYIRCGTLRGQGGMPVGTSGLATVLISGGIDSPVAAYMMAKRGLKLNAVHFESPPYTSERARLKVEKLLKLVSRYAGSIEMHTVPLTKIQETIRDDCPEELFTILLRRVMMKISSRIAESTGSGALITGESLGQVASQTMYALGCTDAAASKIVLRPLIGMDKQEIINISRRIDTFETSIEPYEDCCTVFTPKHPRTKPVLKFVEIAEREANLDEMIEEAIANTTVKTIDP
ncbi:MAG: tRNA 4-thiouridine(8) synthase ThiI [Ruminococcus sp.]|nr:tRNA 4-thiouridine(8) synthase ThiI [Ruminococcus sp.]